MSYESQKLVVYVKFLIVELDVMVYLFPSFCIFMKLAQIQNCLYLAFSPAVISWLENLLLFLKEMGRKSLEDKLPHVLIGVIALVSP